MHSGIFRLLICKVSFGSAPMALCNWAQTCGTTHIQSSTEQHASVTFSDSHSHVYSQYSRRGTLCLTEMSHLEKFQIHKNHWRGKELSYVHSTLMSFLHLQVGNHQNISHGQLGTDLLAQTVALFPKSGPKENTQADSWLRWE